MNWDGKERRNVATEMERDRLLTQIDTKVSILLNTFDQHVKEDKEQFEKNDKRLSMLEKIYGIAGGVVIALEFYFRFIKKN